MDPNMFYQGLPEAGGTLYRVYWATSAQIARLDKVSPAIS